MEGKAKNRVDLRIRTQDFALRVIRLYTSLPKSPVAQTLGKQVLRSGTSVGAQLSEGVRSRSQAEIISKWESALQELEETQYWFALLVGAKVVKATQMSALRKECDELIAIITSCVKRMKTA